MRHTWTSALLGLVVFSVTLIAAENHAFCQRGSRGGNGWDFVAKKYDKDNDGKVTAAEYTRGAEAFKTLDKNGDGSISSDDWSTARGGRRDRGTAPEVGQVAPDFTLTHVSDANQQATLSSFAGKKPVALIFGSCT